MEVVLMPAPERKHSGHCIRVAHESNPEWYREFCGRFESRRRDARRTRKFKTLIKRRETLAALGRIIEGGRETPYTLRLKDFIRDEGRNYLR
jgi:hypothetical protein